MKLFSGELELNRLIKRMQGGDQRAAEKLYIKMMPKVYGFCMNRVGNPHLAEDLTQDIFLRLVEKVEIFDSKRGSFSVWFWQIARNVVADHYRKRQEVAFVDVGEDRVEVSAAYDPSQALTYKLEYERVSSVVRCLDQEEQELFEMRFVIELSYKEIAEILGKSEGSLRVAANRLKQKLQKSFQ